MLEIRPNCEHCNCDLPRDSDEAMICTFECTFCVNCVSDVLENVCPNCGGGFEKRPIRPKEWLKKHPISDKRIYKPIDSLNFKVLLNRLKNIKPRER